MEVNLLQGNCCCVYSLNMLKRESSVQVIRNSAKTIFVSAHSS